MADGRYIAFEGAEGCGKSTISRLLALEFDAVLTREHGGTRIGKQVRAIVANPDHTELDDRAEALLIAGDRAQHARADCGHGAANVRAVAVGQFGSGAFGHVIDERAAMAIAKAPVRAEIHAHRGRRMLIRDADPGCIHTADSSHADAHLGFERIGAGAPHLAASGDHGSKDLGVEQAPPDFGRRCGKNRGAFALQRAAKLGAAGLRLGAAIGAACGHRLRIGEFPEAIERKRQFDVFAP